MKQFRFKLGRQRRRGFSLVEGVLSLAIISFGFLALAPLLVLGLGSAHLARENRATAQIATPIPASPISRKPNPSRAQLCISRNAPQRIVASAFNPAVPITSSSGRHARPAVQEETRDRSRSCF